LAGSIDFVAEDTNGNLVLFDWKRTKGLPDKYDNSYKRMLPPLQHIRDCSGWHYRLQLSCYRYLLEKYYDRTVSGMFVVCTHPEHADCAFVDTVPVLQHETELLMQDQRCRAAQQDRCGGGSSRWFDVVDR